VAENGLSFGSAKKLLSSFISPWFDSPSLSFISTPKFNPPFSLTKRLYVFGLSKKGKIMRESITHRTTST
jgi:hypothetical protein